MKILRICLYVGLAASAAGAVLFYAQPPMAEESPVPPVALEQSAPEPEPEIQVVEIRETPEPVVVQEPVLPIEERGDAILFEAEALHGTPFDQAVTMPFD